MSVSKAIGAPYQQLDLVVDGFESRIAQAAAQRIENVVTIPHDLGSLFLLMGSRCKTVVYNAKAREIATGFLEPLSCLHEETF